MNELLVAADLISRQFDVYRALNPDAACDLLALKDGCVLRIEVRTGVDPTPSGHICIPRGNDDAGRQDHFAVCLPDGTILYEPALP